MVRWLARSKASDRGAGVLIHLYVAQHRKVRLQGMHIFADMLILLPFAQINHLLHSYNIYYRYSVSSLFPISLLVYAYVRTYLYKQQ